MSLPSNINGAEHTFAPNQIICGEARATLARFAAESIDLVITDPPYLCNYQDRSGRLIANDTNAEGVLPAFEEIYRLMKPDSYCISFYGWTAIADFAKTWERVGFRTVGHIVWTKDYTSKSGFMNYQHESAFVLAKGRPRQPAHPIDDVRPWYYTGNKAHPTEKDVRIIAPLVTCFSEEGDVVMDPFLGSGTTAVAAALNKRRYLGVELKPEYCSHAKRRLAGVERYHERF